MEKPFQENSGLCLFPVVGADSFSIPLYHIFIFIFIFTVIRIVIFIVIFVFIGIVIFVFIGIGIAIGIVLVIVISISISLYLFLFLSISIYFYFFLFPLMDELHTHGDRGRVGRVCFAIVYTNGVYFCMASAKTSFISCGTEE